MPAHVADYIAQCDGNYHHFALNGDLIRAIGRKEVLDTWSDLAAAGLLHLPFPAVAVSFRWDDLLQSPGWYKNFGVRTEIIVSFVAHDELSAIDYSAGLPRPGAGAHLDGFAHVRHVSGAERVITLGEDGYGAAAAQDCVAAAGILVTALAARNTLKTTRTNTRIGTGKRIKWHFMGAQGAVYLSSTVLDMPPAHSLAADPDHPAPAGTSPRPHLRRGHAHHYAVGPGRVDRIRKWVAPCFVNADADFVAAARAYVLK